MPFPPEWDTWTRAQRTAYVEGLQEQVAALTATVAARDQTIVELQATVAQATVTLAARDATILQQAATIGQLTAAVESSAKYLVVTTKAQEFVQSMIDAGVDFTLPPPT